MSGWIIVLVAIVVAVASVAAYVFAPKGDNQSVWRSTLILSMVSMYLVWAITYLAQLHPLIQPRRSDLRPEMVD
ncbi:hypothetical protein G7K_4829-t1 [Saitoella complicata NRRL Y-17804]|uniref:V-type proton ATPase subunit n=1 Tax=Saitoella complicata (strain BCRC 22490 / CBS 7301 / JCM 7358 / NBRC 10748 / NRRL Y-17804) TaxID=698492 RepID=A0A0E9NLN4_SAICN|nr:hypothetical protein G7K_4829-t1 [Saitoella complicata NRRL Y-17804]